MAKRPSIIDAIVSLTPAGNGGEKLTEMEPLPMTTAVLRRKKDDVQHTSIYIPRPAFDRLREIAFTERCKVHDLIMQGVDRVLAEHGHEERASRDANKKT